MATSKMNTGTLISRYGDSHKKNVSGHNCPFPFLFLCLSSRHFPVPYRALLLRPPFSPGNTPLLGPGLSCTEVAAPCWLMAARKKQAAVSNLPQPANPPVRDHRRRVPVSRPVVWGYRGRGRGHPAHPADPTTWMSKHTHSDAGPSSRALLADGYTEGADPFFPCSVRTPPMPAGPPRADSR